MRRGLIEVKIEVNFVMRGTIHPVIPASLTPKASEVLLADLEVPVVSLEDLHGGKLTASMDRQHPRDPFDVIQLFEHEGMTRSIRQAFVVYLASHNRPIHEVLFPAKRPFGQEYDGNIRGMTVETVALDDLLTARERMLSEIQTGLSSAERKFLISITRNEPGWSQSAIPHLTEPPAIRWKLQNLAQLAKRNPHKFEDQASALENAIS